MYVHRRGKKEDSKTNFHVVKVNQRRGDLRFFQILGGNTQALFARRQGSREGAERDNGERKRKVFKYLMVLFLLSFFGGKRGSDICGM